MELKICGATRLDEIEILNHCQVSYVGLWSGIENHPRSLPEARLRQLAAACRGPKPVVVCVRPSWPAPGEMMQRCGVKWVQLHGFTSPTDVARLRQQGLSIIKTLHVNDAGECPELRWLTAYDDAGVDIYLIDRFVDKRQIGSTGQALPVRVVENMVEQLAGRRLWLAGGIHAASIGSLAQMAGIEALDIDSAARKDGYIGTPLYGLVKSLRAGEEADV